MQWIKRRLWVTVGLAILLVFIILLPLFAVAAILTDESDNQNGSLSDMESGQIRLEYVSGKMKISQNSIRLDVFDQEGRRLYRFYGTLSGEDVTIYSPEENAKIQGTYKAGKFELYGTIGEDENETEFYMKGPRSSASGYMGIGAIAIGMTEASGKLVFPVANYFYCMTSDYTVRKHPIYGYIHQHAGVDLACAEGADIVAAASGIVTYAGWNGGYGNMVEITHPQGMKTRYGHNSALRVSKGMRVKAGDIIAAAGSTGNSTGPHCHFEVIVKGKLTDPKKYITIPK